MVGVVEPRRAVGRGRRFRDVRFLELLGCGRFGGRRREVRRLARRRRSRTTPARRAVPVPVRRRPGCSSPATTGPPRAPAPAALHAAGVGSAQVHRGRVLGGVGLHRSARLVVLGACVPAPSRVSGLGGGLLVLARRLLGRRAEAVVVVEPPLLGLVDPRLGADARRPADRVRGVGDADRRGLDRGVGQRDEAGLVAVDVDEHPFRASGLAVEVDLTHATESLPASVEDVATGPCHRSPRTGTEREAEPYGNTCPLGGGRKPGVRYGRTSMTDARLLLERHTPRLVYDSHEPYFADSAAIWTDSPTNVLRRADGTVLAKPPKLAAQLPRAARLRGRRPRYWPPTRSATPRATTPPMPPPCTAIRRTRTASTATRGATIRVDSGSSTGASTTTTTSNCRPAGQRRQARGRLGARAAPARPEREARAGGLLPAQDGREQALGRRPEATKAPATPLVYVALGSHANYFGPGSHWTGVWFDQTDGKGRQVAPTLEVLDDARPPWVLVARRLGRHEGDAARRWIPRARPAPAGARTG